MFHDSSPPDQKSRQGNTTLKTACLSWCRSCVPRNFRSD